MSRQTFIFVGAQARDADLMHLMEQTLDGTFSFEEGTDPYIRTGTVAVYVGEHDFDDDDIAWPGGPEVPLRSMYPTMIEFRDTGGDQERQQAIAAQVFAALESVGRWPAVYIDDMQKVLDSYSPPEMDHFSPKWPAANLKQPGRPARKAQKRLGRALHISMNVTLCSIDSVERHIHVIASAASSNVRPVDDAA